MKGMTLEQIIRNSTASRIENSAYVMVKNLQFGISKKLGVPKGIAQTYSKEKGRDNRLKLYHYATMIEFFDGYKVKVSCSCPDHLYRWEYALTRRNASYMTYSNGEPPETTNPSMVPGCCKHVIAMSSYLRKHGMLPK